MKTFVIPSIKRSVAPTANENLSSGYPIGQHWFDTETGKEYYHSSDGVWEHFATTHEALTDKNSEAASQHIDTTTTKSNLDEADKVAIEDSVTGKMVLTPKSNFDADNFIGEYIHSGNKEVIISDYNATTGVFTSLAHGMANGTALYFVARKTVTYPLSVIPDSANLSSAYYVVESTNDTFKLASTAVGQAILFGNTTISLANFFLEVRPYQVGINLGAFYNNLVQIAISNNAGTLMGVNLAIGTTGWRNGNASDYQNPTGTSNIPTVTGYIISEYRFINGICFIRQNGQIVYALSKTSNGVTTHNNRVVTKVTAETGIGGVNLYSPSNGQKLLFYKI